MSNFNNIVNKYPYSEFRAKELALLTLYENGKLTKEQLLLANNFLKENELKQKISFHIESKLEKLINKFVLSCEKRFTERPGRA